MKHEKKILVRKLTEGEEGWETLPEVVAEVILVNNKISVKSKDKVLKQKLEDFFSFPLVTKKDIRHENIIGDEAVILAPGAEDYLEQQSIFLYKIGLDGEFSRE